MENKSLSLRINDKGEVTVSKCKHKSNHKYLQYHIYVSQFSKVNECESALIEDFVEEVWFENNAVDYINCVI